jgi:transcriptional regulator with XRE-family HTH domain
MGILLPVSDDPQPKGLSKSLGQRLKDHRDALGETQAQMAERLCVGQSRVSDIERGRYANLDLKTLVSVAKELALEINILIEGYDTAYDSLVSDLPRQGARGKTPAAKAGVPHVASKDRARALELESRVSELEKSLVEAGRIAGQLVELITLPAARKTRRTS